MFELSTQYNNIAVHCQLSQYFSKVQFLIAKPYIILFKGSYMGGTKLFPFIFSAYYDFFSFLLSHQISYLYSLYLENMIEIVSLLYAFKLKTHRLGIPWTPSVKVANNVYEWSNVE